MCNFRSRISATFGRWLLRALLGLLAGNACVGPAAAADLRGAGATFPAPVYSAWAERYKRATGIDIDYAPTGSVAGTAAIEHGEVDFGASDLPLAPAELARLKLRQFPAVIGGVVPVLNITGIAPGVLKLTGSVLAAIYLGRLRHWNDPAIVALNPGLDLPAANITVVHRLDGSGTTRLWSEFLAASSGEWRATLGTSSTLVWPTGVAESGNEGVASAVQRTRFAIGYVGYSYALQHGLSFASLRNRDGRFVLPSTTTFEAAAAGSDYCGDLGSTPSMVDRPGSGSWPITTASFILLPKEPEAPQRSQRVLAFFDWALEEHTRMAIDLGYAPVPQTIACVAQRRSGADGSR